MSSHNQGNVQASPGTSGLSSWYSLINVAPPWQNPNFVGYGEVVKNGSGRLILKISGANDIVTKWLGGYVGSQIVVYVPQPGVAWTATLAKRKKYGYLFVRIPSNLRRIFASMWQAGYPIPIVISIPQVVTR
jgi:hypothetical protein